MVATRHSLPTTTSFTTTTTSSSGPSAAEPVGSGTHTKKQRALLKQLNIDAKDAILDGSRRRGGGGGGGREDGQEKQVYHYRGSVYEVVGNEPVEWLQQQPERWRRKKGGEMAGREEVGQGRGSVTGSGNGGRKRKRDFKRESAEKRSHFCEKKAGERGWVQRTAGGRGCGYHSPRENRAQMAVNEVLQLAAINSRIHTLAQQHKKMRKELEILRHNRETDTIPYPAQGSEASKSLEIPDSEGSFTDPVPPRTSTTTTTSSSAEEPSVSRHEDTTTTTMTTRSLSTSSSSTTSSYATATSPTSQPTPSFHPPNLPDPNLTSSKANPPPPTSTSSSDSSPPTRTPLPPTQPSPRTGTLPPEAGSRKRQKEKSWSFLTDLQRGVERGEYDRAEVGGDGEGREGKRGGEGVEEGEEGKGRKVEKRKGGGRGTEEGEGGEGSRGFEGVGGASKQGTMKIFSQIWGGIGKAPRGLTERTA
ncbi:hypothetical protein KC318_g30 [Hortaea werneckii]|nr:hypothetical protein KC334_g28 [Hortaea werneckii]KAI7028360.1 hypothetical protein KC355_g31 [Hortaea werneckii]KAI7676815.1 hypothetical protein KC318_g30 [Hortaea werneckii]